MTILACVLGALHLRARAELNALGERVTIYVVAAPLDQGHVIGQADVVELSMPRTFALTTAVDSIADRVTRYELAPGDVLTTSNTTSHEEVLIPVGWRGLTIDAGPLATRLTLGSVVDVMANGSLLVEGALVIDTVADSRSVLIAVPQDRVVAVADAASVGVAVLAIAN